jgi:hypothetical protein
MNLHPLFISKVLDRGEMQSDRIKWISASLFQFTTDFVEVKLISNYLRSALIIFVCFK